jgi:hypothetical protein
MVKGAPSSEKLFIEGDLNGHISTTRGGLREYMGVLDMANRIKREKNIELHYSL